MSLALAMLFQNEEQFLSLHLPYLLQSAAIDGIVAIDGGSTDNSASAIARACIASGKYMTIFQRPFAWDFSAQANFLLSCTELIGYTHILRLDPDECLFIEDITKIRIYLESDELRGLSLGFRRYNFEGDRLHYMPQYYPDWQIRAWATSSDIRYSGRVHEHVIGFPYNISDVVLYHYEGLRNDKARRLKHINYARIADGLMPLGVVPEDDTDTGELRERSEFTKRQPLDPAIIGERAPF